jgi:hypothetical protein
LACRALVDSVVGNFCGVYDASFSIFSLMVAEIPSLWSSLSEIILHVVNGLLVVLPTRVFFRSTQAGLISGLSRVKAFLYLFFKCGVDGVVVCVCWRFSVLRRTT